MFINITKCYYSTLRLHLKQNVEFVLQIHSLQVVRYYCKYIERYRQQQYYCTSGFLCFGQPCRDWPYKGATSILYLGYFQLIHILIEIIPKTRFSLAGRDRTTVASNNHTAIFFAELHLYFMVLWKDFFLLFFMILIKI